MHPSVRDAWLAFTESFEGGIASPYLDIRGLLTIAYGNLVASPAEFAALPLVRPSGSPATTAEKLALYERLTAPHVAPRLAQQGWRAAAALTDLRLTRQGMASLALGRLMANESVLRTRLPDWDSYPACGQMGMHSIAWACGPAAHFPRLFAAVAARDWDIAAVEIHMRERTPEGLLNAGLVPRNVANKILMRNAARVEAYHLDPNTLEWTHLIGVTEADTVPEMPAVRPEPEEVTGSGGIIHPWHFGDDPPEDVA